MTRPLAIDLFCGAGGASMGLHRAGFDVVGVDLRPQPRYPFTFVQGDATAPPVDLSRAVLVWASPPCQRWSCSTPPDRRAGHPALIDATRALFSHLGAITIIENVPLAPVRPDVVLTGAMFGLNTYRRRHFELGGWWAMAPHPGARFGPRSRPGAVTLAGNSGGKRYHASTGALAPVGTVPQWRAAVGIDWMTGPELAESIPPAYAEFLGRAALAWLTLDAAA